MPVPAFVQRVEPVIQGLGAVRFEHSEGVFPGRNVQAECADAVFLRRLYGCGECLQTLRIVRLTAPWICPVSEANEVGGLVSDRLVKNVQVVTAMGQTGLHAFIPRRGRV